MRARALHLPLIVAAGAMLACEPPPAPAPAEVVLVFRSASADVPLAALAPDLVPAGDHADPRRALVPVSLLPMSVRFEGFCPTTIERPVDASRPVEVLLAPLVSVGPVAAVGHDADFRIEVDVGCREAIAASIVWSVVSVRGGSPESVALRTERNGFVVHGHTPPRALSSGARWGIVPISAHGSGEVVLSMRWVPTSGADPIERTVRVLAEPRATGLPSVGLGSTVLLRGGPFSVRERPTGSHAEVTTSRDLERLVPDAPGRWLLADPSARTLAIRVGDHTSTPLDCGRSDCHATEAREALESPMTSAFAGHVSDTCAFPCHTTGEPGLPDGGFVHVARELGWLAPEPSVHADHESLPRALRRLGGVGCTACHGPGAIPEEGAGWAILRSDVCAVCHDAPPRYGHVAAWATSAMARSDVREASHAGECAGCHTTAGFLHENGFRAETTVPDDAGPVGIACAACHAPHAERRLDRALVRRIDPPSALGDVGTLASTTSSICLGCHSPTASSVRASSAAILLGRGGLVVADGTALAAEPPHAGVACIGCHAAAPASELERGAAHAFAIDPARCVACHTERGVSPAVTSDGRIEARSIVLAAAFGLGADDHTHGATAVPTTPRDRAIVDLRLVLSDPGAWAHAPGYAGVLLDEVERGR